MQTGKNGQAGFTYLLLLAGLSVMAFILLRSTEPLANRWRQQQEAQLLFAGDAIRSAIAQYRQNPQADGCFPVNFQQLLNDNRGGRTRYLLRRLYTDPLTGKDWSKIYDGSGRWVGVHSLAQGSPLKKTGFAQRYETFKEATRYSDWQFSVAEDPMAPEPQNCGSEKPGL
jgi:type II secretory pathway pseudopilin PulG